METSKILTADLLDLVFDGKNKSYGAYDLRKTYQRRINVAMMVTAFVCLLFIAGSLLATGKKSEKKLVYVNDVSLEKLKPEEKKEEPIPQKMPEEKIKTIQNVMPRIVPDDQVKPEDEVPPVEALAETKIGAKTQDGADLGDVVEPPVEKGTGTVPEPKKEEDYEGVFTQVQIVAEFPGGFAAWSRYLERYLNSNLPADNGAPPGKYPVTLSFIISKTGEISDVVAENDPGYGTKAEAIRVLLKSPKWTPAEQNGHKVIYRHKQTITFLVNAE